MATADDIRSAVTSYARLWSSGNQAEWLQLFSPDATLEDPVGSEVRHGHAELVEFWDLVQGMADGLELTLTGPVRVAGNEAAFSMQAFTTVGDDRFVVDIIDTMTFDDEGRITSMRAYWDASEMRPA